MLTPKMANQYLWSMENNMVNQYTFNQLSILSLRWRVLSFDKSAAHQIAVVLST